MSNTRKPSRRGYIRCALEEFAHFFESRWGDLEMDIEPEPEKKKKEKKPKKKKEIKAVGRFAGMEMYPSAGEKPAPAPKEEPKASTFWGGLDFYDAPPEKQDDLVQTQKKATKGKKPKGLSPKDKAKVQGIVSRLQIRPHRHDKTMLALKLRGVSAAEKADMAFLIKALKAGTKIVTGGYKTMTFVAKDWWDKVKKELE